MGVLELNQVPKNYFADIEQSAFAPAHLVDGIGYSPDKMLQGRLLSYPDAHRHRLGGNYEQIPVNRCPYAVNNYQRDGVFAINGNGEDAPNYFPNSFDDITVDASYKEPAMPLESTLADWYDRNGKDDNDHFTLVTQKLTENQKNELIEICNQKIHEYEEKRGLKKIWDYRSYSDRVRTAAARGGVLAARMHVDASGQILVCRRSTWTDAIG